MAAKSDPNEPVTRGILDEVVNAILSGMDRMFNELRQEMKEGFNRVDERFKQVDKRFKQVDERFKRVEAVIKDEANGLKAELSDTVSRKEFETVKRDLHRLKQKVAHHHPLN